MMQLVTGGAGFIGSHLVRALLAEGGAVRVVDNFSTGRRENLADLANMELLEGDLCDPTVAASACRGVDVIFHEAAIPSVPRSVADPWSSHVNNLDATLQLLLAARNAGVRRFIYAASSSAYGNTPTLPKVETMPARPLSPYAVAKYGCELYAKVFNDLYGLETISLRYFNVFGPRQDPSSPYSGVISRFLAALGSGKKPIIFGDGRQTRDFTYVANAVQANLLARTMGTPGSVYNVGTGAQVSLLQVLEMLATALQVQVEPRFESARAGDVRDSMADISCAARELGYAPSVSAAEGLNLTAQWFRSAGTAPR